MVQEKLKTTPVNPILTPDDFVQVSSSDISSSWPGSESLDSSTGYYYDSSVYDVTGTESPPIDNLTVQNISCRELQVAI